MWNTCSIKYMLNSCIWLYITCIFLSILQVSAKHLILLWSRTFIFPIFNMKIKEDCYSYIINVLLCSAWSLCIYSRCYTWTVYFKMFRITNDYNENLTILMHSKSYNLCCCLFEVCSIAKIKSFLSWELSHGHALWALLLMTFNKLTGWTVVLTHRHGFQKPEVVISYNSVLITQLF